MTLAASDSSRIDALERYRFLDTTTDETLDSLVRLAADVCGTSLARLSLVDRTSHEFRVGLDADARAIGRELSRCRPNAEADSSRVRFYAGIGVRASDGSAVGTLCVIDNLPRVFTDVQRRSLRTIAAQIGALLEAWRQIERLKREACGVLVDRPVSLLSRGVHPDPLGKAYEDLLRDPGARVAVAAVGIDAVRLVDESLGHGAGDALMAACVERIVKSVRSTETVARYGDSQIVVILQDVKDSIAATTIAKRILGLFEESVDIEGYALRIRASVGMTMMDAGHRHLIDLIREASSAMYHATSLGEVSIALFTPMLHDIAVNRLRMEGEIRRAIDAREFCLFYQPIFALTTMTLVGFEALVRWQHPKRGLVMPDQFIRIAEETGLIEPIGEWVLREACRQLSAWRRQYPLFAELAVSVNVSAKQFRNDRLFNVVTDALSDAQLDASCLRIEITETVLMEQSDTAVETLLRLRELGVSAHLDDFGCGYSSLNYLKNFPVSTLKIDRSFISSSGVRIANREIVQAVIALAGALDVEIVAEGIETREQLEQLQELGCAHGQGYLLSKPLSAGDALPFAIARSGKQTVELQHSATV